MVHCIDETVRGPEKNEKGEGTHCEERRRKKERVGDDYE
jgi:hypothetical protein